MNKRDRMLVELTTLTEEIASGQATPEQIERALKLEADIPWPQAQVAFLVAKSSALSRVEAKLEDVKALRLKLMKSRRKT